MTHNTSAKRSGFKAQSVAEVAIFAALILLMAFTPFLGYIPLGFTRATIIHIPVILGAVLLGPKQGAVLGFVFGLTSLINNTVNPTATSFAFSPFYSVGETSGNWASLVICFIPRILIGVVAYYVYLGVKKAMGDRKSGTTLALGAAGLCGALTNTLLVMNLIFLFFRDAYGIANGVAKGAEAVYTLILSVIGINGVPEAIVATVIVAVVGTPLLRISRKMRDGSGRI